LKINTEPLEMHQIKLTVEVDPETMESAKQRAARSAARKVKIPGFRPGKAPYHVILRTIGEEAILEEALELVAQDVYPKAIEEANIQAYGPGSFDNMVSLDPPVLEFVIPLAPEVTLADYHAMSKPYDPPAVDEAEVDKVIQDFQERQAILEPVERPAEEGDMVTVKLNADRLGVDEGEDATLVKDQSVPILVRPEETAEAQAEEDEDDQEWPYPGYSRTLIGLSAGDTNTVLHRFADTSRYESLRGVEAEFVTIVEAVKSRTLPELDDNFASTVNAEYADLASLRADVRKNLEQRAEDEYNSTYDTEVVDELVEASSFQYPPQMMEREIDEMIHQLGHRLEPMKMDIDLYLKSRQMEMEALREEMKPSAEKRIKRDLVLSKLAELEKIEVTPAELQSRTMETLGEMAQSLSKKDAQRLGNQDVINNIMQSVAMELIMSKSIERLRLIVSGRYVEEPSTEGEPEETEAQEPVIEESTGVQPDEGEMAGE